MVYDPFPLIYPLNETIVVLLGISTWPGEEVRVAELTHLFVGTYGSGKLGGNVKDVFVASKPLVDVG